MCFWCIKFLYCGQLLTVLHSWFLPSLEPLPLNVIIAIGLGGGVGVVTLLLCCVAVTICIVGVCCCRQDKSEGECKEAEIEHTILGSLPWLQISVVMLSISRSRINECYKFQLYDFSSMKVFIRYRSCSCT